MLQMNIYEEFAHWLDDLLENNEMPESTQAYCFNLYEESDEDHIYGVQLVAAGEFDPRGQGRRVGLRGGLEQRQEHLHSGYLRRG